MDILGNRELKRDFINELIQLSNGNVNERQAVELADQYFNSTHIYEGSPLSHKGLSILAKQVLVMLNLL